MLKPDGAVRSDRVLRPSRVLRPEWVLQRSWWWQRRPNRVWQVEWLKRAQIPAQALQAVPMLVLQPAPLSEGRDVPCLPAQPRSPL